MQKIIIETPLSNKNKNKNKKHRIINIGIMTIMVVRKDLTGGNSGPYLLNHSYI